MKRVHLVTVLYNSEGVLRDFIESLKKQEEVEWRLYAIDNASTDNGIKYLEELRDHRIQLIKNERNEGVAYGNNQGIIQALADGAEWILLLNNDTSFDKNTVIDLVNHSIENKSKVSSPCIVYADHPEKVWYNGGYMKKWPFFGNLHHEVSELKKNNSKEYKYYDYAPTCFLLLHRDVILNVGLMWEEFFVYSDDVDYMVRIKKWGYKTMVDNSIIVRHHVGYSSGGEKSAFCQYYGARNHVLLMRRHLSKVHWMTLFILSIAKDYFLYLLKKTKSKHTTLIKAKYEGLKLKLI